MPESVEFDFDDNGLIETNNSRILHPVEQLKELKLDSTKEEVVSDDLKFKPNVQDDIKPGQCQGGRKNKKKKKKNKKNHGGVAVERLEAGVHQDITAGDNGTTKGNSDPGMIDENTSKETDMGGGNLEPDGNICKETDKGGGNSIPDGRDGNVYKETDYGPGNLEPDMKYGNMCKETDYGPGNLEPDMKDGNMCKETDYGPGNLEPDMKDGNMCKDINMGTGELESEKRNDNSVKDTDDGAGKLATYTRYGNDFSKTDQATGNVQLDIGNVFEFKGFSPTIAQKESDNDNNFKDIRHKEDRWKPGTSSKPTGSSANIINRNGKFESGAEVECMGYVEGTFTLANDNAEPFYWGKFNVSTSLHYFINKNDQQAGVSSREIHFPATRKSDPENTSLSKSLRLKLTYFLQLGLFLLLMSGSVVNGALTTVPANTIVYGGQTAKLTCTTNANQRVYWMRILSESGTQQWLYYGDKGLNVIYDDGRFSIDESNPGCQDLVIAGVQPTDAGNYICMDESGMGERAAAELIVIGTMHCDDTALNNGVMAKNVFAMKHDIIQLTCNVTYKGNLAPTLNWGWRSSEQQQESLTIVKTSNSVTSTLKLIPTKELNGAKFTLQAAVDGGRSRDIDNRLTWESIPITVRYAELEETSVPQCPGINLNLVCNPACSYIFVETENSGCECQYTYSCGPKEQTYTTTSENIACTNKPTNHESTTTAIVIVTILIPVTACIFVALGFLIRKIKRTREERNKLVNDTNRSRNHNSDTIYVAISNA